MIKTIENHNNLINNFERLVDYLDNYISSSETVIFLKINKDNQLTEYAVGHNREIPVECFFDLFNWQQFEIPEDCLVHDSNEAVQSMLDGDYFQESFYFHYDDSDYLPDTDEFHCEGDKLIFEGINGFWIDKDEYNYLYSESLEEPYSPPRSCLY